MHEKKCVDDLESYIRTPDYEWQSKDHANYYKE